MEFTIFPTLDVIETAAKGDDAVWTAVCDMRSMIARGGVSVDPATCKRISAALLTCYEQLPQDAWCEMVIKSMAALQGLCVHQTWDDWQLLNGC